MGNAAEFLNGLTFEWYKAVKNEEWCRACDTKPEKVIDLHYHHVNPKTKRGTISQMARGGASITDLMAEMRKCVVVCVDCHDQIHSGLRKGWLVARGDNDNEAKRFMPYAPFIKAPAESVDL